VDGVYKSPATDDELPLDEAVKFGLVVGELLDTKRKTEERILDSTNIISKTMDDSDDEETHESNLHVSLVVALCNTLLTYIVDVSVDDGVVVELCICVWLIDCCVFV